MSSLENLLLNLTTTPLDDLLVAAHLVTLEVMVSAENETVQNHIEY